MISRTLSCFCFAAACFATILILPVAGTAMAATSSGWSARANMIQSQRYDRMLETNRAFRHARMRKECGPISDPQLRQNCLASFSQDEPFVGSSAPRHHYRSDYGR
jgi:hypothetical protein